MRQRAVSRGMLGSCPRPDDHFRRLWRYRASWRTELARYTYRRMATSSRRCMAVTSAASAARLPLLVLSASSRWASCMARPQAQGGVTLTSASEEAS